MVYVAVDDFSQRKLLEEGQREWLRDHDELLMRWLDENIINENDWDMLYNNVMYFYDEILSFIFYLYFRQRELSAMSKLDTIVNRLHQKDGFVLVIFGERGSGKTTLAFIIAEMLKRKYGEKIYWLGPPAILPPFIEGSTTDFDKLPKNSTDIIDEASVQFFSRMAMQKDQSNVIRKLSLLRQTGRNLIVISQTSDLLDINFLRQSNALIFTSQFYLRMKKQRIIVNEHLNYFMPKQQGEALYYDNNMILEIKFQKPEWWKSLYSNPYATFNSDTEAYRYALQLMQDIINPKMIKEYLSMKAYSMSEPNIQYIRMIAEDLGLDELLAKPDAELETIIKQGMSDTPLQDMLKGKTNYAKFNFSWNPIFQDVWKRKMQSNEILNLMFARNYNHRFLKSIMERLTKEGNIVLSVRGPTGTGKSWFAQAIAEIIFLIYKKPLQASFCFTTEQASKNAQELKEKGCIVLDEQIKTFGTGSGRSGIELQNIVETTRKRGLSFIFVSPELKVGTSLHHLILETTGQIDEKEGVSKAVVFTPDNQPLGYVTIRKPSKRTITEYTKAKDDFMAKVVNREGFKNWDDIARQLDADDNFTEGCTNNDMRKMYILEKFNVTTGEAEMILAKWNFLQFSKKQLVTKQ